MEKNLKVFKSDKFGVVDPASLSLFLYPKSAYVFLKDANQSTIAIHSYHEYEESQLKKLLESDPLLKKNLPLKVYFHQTNVSLVPGILFQSGQEKSYLSFVTEQNDDDFFFSTTMDSNNIQIVSSISENNSKVLQANFSEITYRHGACSFLSYAFKERFNLIDQEILVNVFEGNLYAAAFSNQELMSFNIFELENQNDFVKYVRVLIEQLKFNKNHVRISVYGKVEGLDLSKSWGDKYFHNYQLKKLHANQNFASGMKNIDQLGIIETSWQFD